MTIEQIIREQHGGAYWALLHIAEGGRYKFLPTGETISAAEYAAIKRTFSGANLSADERRRNTLRGKAIDAHD